MGGFVSRWPGYFLLLYLGIHKDDDTRGFYLTFPFAGDESPISESHCSAYPGFLQLVPICAGGRHDTLFPGDVLSKSELEYQTLPLADIGHFLDKGTISPYNGIQDEGFCK